MGTDECRVCESELEFAGYRGNWKVLKCKDCEKEVMRPVGETGSDNLSKEDLNNLSKF